MTEKSTKQIGARGPRGKTGPVGPKGPPGNHGREIARLSAQMDEVVKELQVQLTRIAQIQAQLDHLARGHSPESDDRERIEREDH